MSNATSLTPKEDEQDGYQFYTFYTRVLAGGDVAPSFSPEAEEHTTISIQSINRQVTYKFVRQEDSMTMSSSLSLLALLTSLCMELLSLTALLKGLLVVWAKKVSSAKDGALSFLGPRSLHTVVQPNPSEGDVTSFWY